MNTGCYSINSIRLVFLKASKTLLVVLLILTTLSLISCDETEDPDVRVQIPALTEELLALQARNLCSYFSVDSANVRIESYISNDSMFACVLICLGADLCVVQIHAGFHQHNGRAVVLPLWNSTEIRDREMLSQVKNSSELPNLKYLFLAVELDLDDPAIWTNLGLILARVEEYQWVDIERLRM